MHQNDLIKSYIIIENVIGILLLIHSCKSSILKVELI